jgi:hypothetical protein
MIYRQCYSSLESGEMGGVGVSPTAQHNTTTETKLVLFFAFDRAIYMGGGGVGGLVFFFGNFGPSVELIH